VGRAEKANPPCEKNKSDRMSLRLLAMIQAENRWWHPVCFSPLTCLPLCALGLVLHWGGGSAVAARAWRVMGVAVEGGGGLGGAGNERGGGARGWGQGRLLNPPPPLCFPPSVRLPAAMGSRHRHRRAAASAPVLLLFAKLEIGRSISLLFCSHPTHAGHVFPFVSFLLACEGGCGKGSSQTTSRAWTTLRRGGEPILPTPPALFAIRAPTADIFIYV
jgi:hypothetical protein